MQPQSCECHGCLMDEVSYLLVVPPESEITYGGANLNFAHATEPFQTYPFVIRLLSAAKRRSR